jgi:hypothetical protein
MRSATPARTTFVTALKLTIPAAIAWLALTSCARDRAGGPFPESEYQAGEVVQGTEVVHAFPIHNTTDHEIRIRRIGTANGATVLHCDSVVRPGERGTIRISVATHGQRGPIDGLANVYTDNPTTPVASLHLKGTVVLPLEVTPRRQAYFFAVKGELATQVLSLVNHSERPVHVKAVKSDNARFAVRSRQVQAGRRYELTVTLDPSTPPGKHEGQLTVTTDSPQFSEVVIPSFALVKDSLSTSIDTVQFGQIAYGALENKVLSRKSVMVKKHGATDFRVLSASTDVPFLTVDVAPHKAGESSIVNVRIIPKRAKRGLLVGTLRMTTTDRARPELLLPIRANIR